MGAVPVDCVFGEDNILVSALDSGYAFYAGYVNGSWPNMTALRTRFKSTGAAIVGIATRMDSFTKDAEVIDCEPGTVSSTLAGNQAAALEFLRAWNPAGKATDKPVVYVMGSWAQAMQDYLAAYGHDRSKYYMWTAHYGQGLHLCGPSSCGLVNVQADGTQYSSGRNDWNVFRGYVIGKSAPPVTPPHPGIIKYGDTGPAVTKVQQLLNGWQPVVWTYAPLLTDGHFNGITLSAVRAFQKWAGLAVDGVVGANTMAALKKALPSPPPAHGVTFSHPQGLKVKAGRTNFVATWKAPAGVAKTQAVPYQVYVYEGTPEKATLVASYPREIPATTRAVLQSTAGSLKRHTNYVLHVVAGTGKQVRPWDYAVVTFKTA